MVVDKKADWQRCCQGGENIAANALLFHVLRKGADMAATLGDHNVVTLYSSLASMLASAMNNILWDDNIGAFRDNPTSSLYPQDGNSLAVWFGVTKKYPNRSILISNYLHSNWGVHGAASPEWNNGTSIGTFPGSMEVFSHFAAGEGKRALDLVRLQWGYMLHSPISTRSTFWEGYNIDGTFNFDGSYMSNAHGWGSGPGGAMTASVLGIRAEHYGSGGGGGGGGDGSGGSGGDDDVDLSSSSELLHRSTPFVVAPQPSGLTWCTGSLSLNEKHTIHVQWNATIDFFHLRLNLNHASKNARGRVELPLLLTKAGEEDDEIEILVDGIVVATRSSVSLLPDSSSSSVVRYSMVVPTPLQSHVYVVRRRRS